MDNRADWIVALEVRRLGMIPTIISWISATLLYFTFTFAAAAQSSGGLSLGFESKMPKDVQIKLIAFDPDGKSETVIDAGVMGNLPDLIFEVLNNSSSDAHIFLGSCDFINFALPEQIVLNSYDPRIPRRYISSLNTSAGILARGSPRVRVPPGQRKYISYGIGYLTPPSFEARQRGTSSCNFVIGSALVGEEVTVQITSPGKYFQKK
jgi:hypothetical protein